MVHGPGGMTLQKTVTWAHLRGVAELTAPSLSDRPHQSVGFFAAITSRLLAARAPPETSPWHGRCLHLCDSSSISQPGSKGTDWRVHAVYDLGRSGFSHLELTDAQGAETINRGTPVAGSVMIADRGHAKAREMEAFLDAGDGACHRDFIVRTGWNALRLETMDGAPFDLIAKLVQMETGPNGPPRGWNIQALHGRNKRIRRLPIRLVILPLPPDKAEIAREKAKRAASKHQSKIDPRTLLAAGFMMLATSLPETIPVAGICAVYRLRWQIELAFKRLKSLIGIDRIPTHTEAGSLSWLYPHLILALLTDDICQEILESSPCGPGWRRTSAVNLVNPENGPATLVRRVDARELHVEGLSQSGSDHVPAPCRSQTKAAAADELLPEKLILMPMRVTPAPRADPGVRLSRTGLLPEIERDQGSGLWRPMHPRSAGSQRR
jgi:hypothetical protein